MLVTIQRAKKPCIYSLLSQREKCKIKPIQIKHFLTESLLNLTANLHRAG